MDTRVIEPGARTGHVLEHGARNITGTSIPARNATAGDDEGKGWGNFAIPSGAYINSFDPA